MSTLESAVSPAAVDTGNSAIFTSEAGRIAAVNRILGERRLAASPLARWELQASSPLALQWLPDGTTLEASSMNLLAPGLGDTPLALRWDNSRWLTGNSDIGLITSGTLSGLPLHWLDQLARSDERPDGALAQARLQGDMVFDARWMLRLPRLGTEGAQGEFTLERRSGDLALRTDPATPGDGPLAAGVTQAVLGLQIEGGDIKASALWDSQRAGRVSAQVRSWLTTTTDKPRLGKAMTLPLELPEGRASEFLL